MLLGVFDDGALGVADFGVEGLDTGFFGGLRAGLEVVRGGSGT